MDDILANHTDAQACIITGDLTHRGELAAYEALHDQLQRLTMPVYPLMGNHDIRKHFRTVFDSTLDDGQGFVQGVRRLDNYSLVMLDTLSEGESGGRYDQPRLDWLAETLAQEKAAQQKVLLFMHHPPFPIGLPCLDRISLYEPDALAQVLAGHHIHHLFFGHVHRPVCGQWRGISYSTQRGLNHQVPFDLDIVKPVPKSHEPPAYAVVLLSDDSVVTHFHDFLDRSRLPLKP